MSHIFAIRKDLPTYQVLDLDLLDATRNVPDTVDLDSVYDFSLRNTPMLEWWEAPETKFISVESGKSQVPDISCWIDASLVLSPKAYRILKDSLSAMGEFLPVSICEEVYYIFNCFQLADANEETSVFDEEAGYRAGLKHLEFDERASDLLVFKTKSENCLTLFCSQRFKEIVESCELRGIVFDEDLVIA